MSENPFLQPFLENVDLYKGGGDALSSTNCHSIRCVISENPEFFKAKTPEQIEKLVGQAAEKSGKKWANTAGRITVLYFKDAKRAVEQSLENLK